MPSETAMTGGAVICRPPVVNFKINHPVGITLMSDLHLGAANVNLKLIQRELERAKELGDRININGDVLDLILAKDERRFSPDYLHPRIRGRADIINEVVDWAVELFSPYVEQIDMIGMGNHESKVAMVHSIDPTKAIVDDLNGILERSDKTHRVHYGAFCGFIDYRFERLRLDTNETSDRHGKRLVIFYHHGAGKGVSPVTKGVGDFAKMDMMIEADLMWLGHNHHRTSDVTQRISCPHDGELIKHKEIRHVRTGAYLNTYVGQSQDSIRRCGRRGNYAADAMMPIGGQGGARLELTFTNNKGSTVQELRVTQ